MDEEKAGAIADAVNIIAYSRARQSVWTSLGKATEASQCAEDAREAMSLLKTILMKEE